MRLIYTDSNGSLAVCRIISLSYDTSDGTMSVRPESSDKDKYEIVFHNISHSAYKYYAKKLFLEEALNLAILKAEYRFI